MCSRSGKKTKRHVRENLALFCYVRNAAARSATYTGALIFRYSLEKTQNNRLRIVVRHRVGRRERFSFFFLKTRQERSYLKIILCIFCRVIACNLGRLFGLGGRTSGDSGRTRRLNFLRYGRRERVLRFRLPHESDGRRTMLYQPARSANMSDDQRQTLPDRTGRRIPAVD